MDIKLIILNDFSKQCVNQTKTGIFPNGTMVTINNSNQIDYETYLNYAENEKIRLPELLNNIFSSTSNSEFNTLSKDYHNDNIFLYGNKNPESFFKSILILTKPEFITKTTNHTFKLSNVLMTGGAGGALNVILKAILDPDDEVIVFTPFFPEYYFYVDNHSGITRIVDSDDKFIPDLDSFNKNINNKTKAVIINSPNNPSGVVYSEQFLIKMSEILNNYEKKFKREIFVISDEPYRRIVFDGLDCPNILDYYKNTIVASSFSKDLAIPGERIGYVALSPKISNQNLLMDGIVFANRVLGFVNAPAFMQRAVSNILFSSVDVEEYLIRRNYLCDELGKLGYEFEKPQGAFYLFPKSPIEDDVEFTNLLKENKVLVVPGSGFGKKGYFRISFCVDWPSIEGSIEGFKKTIELIK